MASDSAGASPIVIGHYLASGIAICAGTPGNCGQPDKPDDPIDVAVQPVQGELVRLGLVSSDGASKMFTKLVPIPLRREDLGCTVDAALLTAAAELVLIEAAGFSANTTITALSDSEGERHVAKVKSMQRGDILKLFLPYRQGANCGTLVFKPKSDKCSPSVSVPWGRSR